jgi:sterol desaturase/sphingolipid hydroxylase (fatty acid hydroxylase superfamily)
MILYDVLHYYFHFGSDFPLPILNSLKKNHMKHHYRDSNRGFGVTTTLWDWLFGTTHRKWYFYFRILTTQYEINKINIICIVYSNY